MPRGSFLNQFYMKRVWLYKIQYALRTRLRAKKKEKYCFRSLLCFSGMNILFMRINFDREINVGRISKSFSWNWIGTVNSWIICFYAHIENIYGNKMLYFLFNFTLTRLKIWWHIIDTIIIIACNWFETQ